MTEKQILVFRFQGEIEPDEKKLLDNNGIIYGSSRALTGGPELIEAIVLVVTPIILTQIGQIITKLIETNRFISINYKGVEVKNVKLKDLPELLKKIEAIMINDSSGQDNNV